MLAQVASGQSPLRTKTSHRAADVSYPVSTSSHVEHLLAIALDYYVNAANAANADL